MTRRTAKMLIGLGLALLLSAITTKPIRAQEPTPTSPIFDLIQNTNPEIGFLPDLAGFRKGRLISEDGNWLAPVSTNILGSNDEDHIRRGVRWSWDFTAPEGTLVHPMADGIITKRQCNLSKVYSNGCEVFVKHKNGYESHYAHLIQEEEDGFLVEINQEVTQVSIIGRIGFTGTTEFSHVHVGINDQNGHHIRLDELFSPNKLVYLRVTKIPAGWKWNWEPTLAPLLIKATNESLETRQVSLPKKGWIPLLTLVVLIIVVFNAFVVTRIVRRVIDLTFLRNVSWLRPTSFCWKAIDIALPIFSASTALGLLIGSGPTLLASSELPTFQEISLPKRSGNDSIPWLPATVSRWSQQIAAESRQTEAEPEEISIIVLIESCGNPKAKSPRGARGLMQIMPATGVDIAQKRKIKGYTTADLESPNINLYLGTLYFAQLKKQFHTRSLGAAAYNGGPGHVQSVLIGGTTLYSEPSRYRYWFDGMWQERHNPDSKTYREWLKNGGTRLCQEAEAQERSIVK